MMKFSCSQCQICDTEQKAIHVPMLTKNHSIKCRACEKPQRVNSLISRRRNCLSLIELLIVIAIIAVLMSLLQPSLSRIMDQARHTACMNNEKNIGVAVHLFMSDSNDNWPRHCTGGAVVPGRWFTNLLHYMEEDPKNTYGHDHKNFHCPSKDDQDLYWWDTMYAMNQEITCQDNSGSQNRVFIKAWAWHKMSQVKSPSELVMWGEGKSASFQWRHYGRTDQAGPSEDAIPYGYGANERTLLGGIQPVHDGYSNYLHADNHVSANHASEWGYTQEEFIEHATRYFHPVQNPSVLPPGPPPGMTW